MRIELRDDARRRIGGIVVDPALRPTRVSVVGSNREVFLNWDIALDDQGQLRRCVACGCTDLYVEKAFPAVTSFIIVLAFIGAVAGVFGFATNPPALIAMGVVLVVDVAILMFSRRRLVCYRCATSYGGLRIARYHARWDRAVAERHPPSGRRAIPQPEGSPDVRAGLRRAMMRLSRKLNARRPTKAAPPHKEVMR